MCTRILVHKNFHLNKTGIGVTRHSIRNHSSECNQGLGHVSQRVQLSLQSTLLTTTWS